MRKIKITLSPTRILGLTGTDTPVEIIFEIEDTVDNYQALIESRPGILDWEFLDPSAKEVAEAIELEKDRAKKSNILQIQDVFLEAGSEIFNPGSLQDIVILAHQYVRGEQKFEPSTFSGIFDSWKTSGKPDITEVPIPEGLVRLMILEISRLKNKNLALPGLLSKWEKTVGLIFDSGIEFLKFIYE